MSKFICDTPVQLTMSYHEESLACEIFTIRWLLATARVNSPVVLRCYLFNPTKFGGNHTVHKGLSGVTMATNFGTKIAINAFLQEITRM